MASSLDSNPTSPPPSTSSPPPSDQSPPPPTKSLSPPPDSNSPPPPDSDSSPPPAQAPPPPTKSSPSPTAPPPSTPDAPPPSTPQTPPPSIPKAPPPATPSPSPPPTSHNSPPKSSPPPPPKGGGGSPAPFTQFASPPPDTASPPPVVPSPPGVPSPPPIIPNSPPPSTFTPPPPGQLSPPPSATTSSTITPSSVSNTTSVTPSSGGSPDGIKYGLAIGVVAAVVVVGFMMGILYLQRKRRRKQKYNPYILPSPFSSSQGSGSPILLQPYTTGGNDSMGDFKNSSSEPGGIGNSKTWFSYEELSLATNGFSSQNILGVGGFGCVYKGYLEHGRIVAVKKLKAGSGQGDREFKAEVEVISRVHHRHLVSLVGYCINDLQRLLVYEFVPNNTLHHHLQGYGQSVMEWSLRVKVAAGSAKGLAYLHEDCHPRIIHRDIKSANILLDNNFEAKVADFGLAKLAEELDANTHVSTRVMGTFGYMAPEYASSGKLTEKSDVFSFGVVLLELITGRKPVDDSQPLGDESLVAWARPLLTQALDTEDFDSVADPRLEGNYDQREMFQMIKAAAACVRHSASKRPKMSQVARALGLLCEVSADLSNGMKPGESEIIDSREQSAQIKMFQRMVFGSQDMSSDYFNSSQGSWSHGGR